MIIHQLIYYSEPVLKGGNRLQLLRDILAASRRNNARDGITGFLLCDTSCFVQILEGEKATVSATYARIERDDRHRLPVILRVRDSAERSFPTWSMGGLNRSPEHEAIFLSHGISGPMKTAALSAPVVMGLAMDLQDFELARRGAKAPVEED